MNTLVSDCYYYILKVFSIKELINYALTSKDNYIIVQKEVGKLNISITPKSNDQLILFCNITNLNLYYHSFHIIIHTKTSQTHECLLQAPS